MRNSSIINVRLNKRYTSTVASEKVLKKYSSNEVKDINLKIRKHLIVGDVTSVLNIYSDMKDKNIEPNTETIILLLYAHRRLPPKVGAEFANYILKTDYINHTVVCNLVIELLFRAEHRLKDVHKIMKERNIPHTEHTSAYNLQASLFDKSQTYLKNDMNFIIKQNLPISYLTREELFKEICHFGKRDNQVIQTIFNSQFYPEFNFVKSIAYYLSISSNPELILHLKEYVRDWFPEECVHELSNYLLLGYINNLMYKKAMKCFNDMKKNPDTWISRDVTFKHIFKMYAKMRNFKSLQSSFNEMLKLNIKPNENTLEGLAEACMITRDERVYKLFHDVVEKYGLMLSPINYRKVWEFYNLCQNNTDEKIREELDKKENKYVFDL